MATFAQWLAGLGCEATGIDQWLYPDKQRRKLYSTIRVGSEALVRRWPMEPVWNWLQRLRELPEHVFQSDGRAIMKNVGIPQGLTLFFVSLIEAEKTSLTHLSPTPQNRLCPTLGGTYRLGISTS